MPKPIVSMAALLLLACMTGLAWAQAALPAPGAPARLATRSQGSVKLAHAGQVLPARPGTVVAVGAGVARALINVAGRGERAPLVPTADGVAEARNRRVEIKLR